MTTIEILVKVWPMLSASAVVLFGSLFFIWRMYTRIQLNERAIMTHAKDDVQIRESLQHTVNNTYTLIHGLNERFDGVIQQVHETHVAVIDAVNKQETDIGLLKARMDRLGGALADLKIAVNTRTGNGTK